jgi:hypothetical protein
MSLARDRFTDPESKQNLDALEQEQCEDGGWVFNWGHRAPADLDRGDLAEGA